MVIVSGQLRSMGLFMTTLVSVTSISSILMAEGGPSALVLGTTTLGKPMHPVGTGRSVSEVGGCSRSVASKEALVSTARGTMGKESGSLRLRGGQADGDGDGVVMPSVPASNHIIVLDIDGTLYGAESGIEQQIVANIHRFALSTCQVTPEESDELHRKYGATIAGLKAEKSISKDLERRFYREVYSAIDYSGLLKSDAGGDTSGYKHSSSLRHLLLRSGARLAIASNSPSWHVKRVLAALGLSNIQWCAVITPDVAEGLTKADALFWSTLLETYQTHPHGVWWAKGKEQARQGGFYQIDLLDDNLRNLAVAQLLGIQGTQVMPDRGFPVEHALLKVLGLLPAPSTWLFDTAKYLGAKNRIETHSLSVAVREELTRQLQYVDTGHGPLRVVDVGAGLLPLLPFFQKLVLASRAEPPASSGDTKNTPLRSLHYVAIEPEDSLFEQNCGALVQAGYVPQEGGGRGGEARGGYLCLGPPSGKGGGGGSVTVSLVRKDVSQLQPRTLGPIHLFVACCFADLVAPQVLARTLIRLAGGLTPTTLVYLPITFAGATRLTPSSPRQGRVPADEQVLQLYHHALAQQQGHHLDPSALISCFSSYGAQACVTPWAPGEWDMAGWAARLRRVRPQIEAFNVDLLFRISMPTAEPTAPHTAAPANAAAEEAGGGGGGGVPTAPARVQGEPDIVRRQQLLFVAKNRVQVVDEGDWRLLSALVPGPGQLLLQTQASVVSSGTELKIFRGDFEAGEQLDTSIQGMTDAKMAYPLAYGYSLVGRVMRVGPGVDETLWMHRQVFAFAAHGSHAVVGVDSAMLVPDGIAAEDACYLPAVETALSLVQDARVIVGETVAVFGQGVIGMVVTALVAKTFGSSHLVAFEVNPHRAAIARRVGAGQVLDPRGGPDGSPLAMAQPPDVSIEVSGSPRALQAALDLTGRGGRVVLGSWYGSEAAALTLGLAFHRSHLSIKCSQVSELPADMSARWDKKRRFEEAWRWVGILKPSSFLTTSSMPLAKAQEGYEMLLKGETLGLQFTYNA